VLLLGCRIFTVELFISEPSIKALAVAIFSGASWFDVSRLRANCRNPVSDSLSNELRTVVVPIHVVIASLLQDRATGKFRSIISDNTSGLSVDGTSSSNSRATRAPEMLVSAIKHRFSRQQSSFTASMRNLRDAPKVSDTKSKDHRSPGRRAIGIGVRDPRARLRPLRRFTPSLTVEAIQLLVVHDHSFAFQQHADPAVAKPTPHSGNRLHLFANFWIIRRMITPDGLRIDTTSVHARRCEIS
jgi:hypothetical protein